MNGRTSAKTIICDFISLQIIFYGTVSSRGSCVFIDVLFILRTVVSLDERFNVVQLDGKRQWLVQIRCYWDMPATYPQIRAVKENKSDLQKRHAHSEMHAFGYLTDNEYNSHYFSNQAVANELFTIRSRSRSASPCFAGFPFHAATAPATSAPAQQCWRIK